MARQRLYGGVRLLGEGPCPRNVARLDFNARPMTHALKFWSKVSKGDPDDCWLWKGRLGAGGYGALGRNIYAHRAAWVLTFGEIPSNLGVLHRCDVRLCVNPRHLFLGTNKDNSDDRKQKGRNPNHHGESNPLSKLSYTSVLTIRDMWGSGRWTQQELASAFNIHQSTVSLIVNRRLWGGPTP